MKPVQPGDDEKFAAFMQQFIALASANMATLGLSAPDISSVTGAQTDLNAKIAASIAARSAASAAVTARHVSRKTANAMVRMVQKKVETATAVPPSLLQQLGIPVRPTHVTPVIPQTPAGLVAMGDGSGFNSLQWKANGNKAPTVYLIEARVGNAPDFTFVANSTRTRYKHEGQTPGVKVTYRVSAQRSSRQSDFSNEAVVYNSATPVPVTAPQLRVA